MGFEVFPNKNNLCSSYRILYKLLLVADTKNVTWPQHHIVHTYHYNQMIHSH